MFEIAKKKMPRLYDYYSHLQRVRTIKNIQKVKKLTFEQQLSEVGRLYKERIGHDLDWNNLKTYTEKMQWEKIYDKNPMKSVLADKYAVRSWVEKKIGNEYLIPVIGVWDQFDDIPFDELPNQFVIKTNHGTGTNVIVKDKSCFNRKRAKRMFDDWVKMDFGYTTGFELHYSDIKPKIVIEKYLETEYGELQDYKFICFDGKPYFCWVDMGRYSNHTRNVYDLDWKLQPWKQERYALYDKPIPKPKNFEKMIKLAENLADGFSHVRVDLYNVNGTIYFGEMTFTNGSGLDRIIPEEYDFILGNLWNINIDGK
ncbi:MAG: ATP-grasp fold amidoligase family protein [Lachnospiraceae bacterium]|nr:ATP-grasp fold amidoligase family protein [Lachnospiraceae bacterium]